MLDFRPPKLNPLIVRLTKALAPPIIKNNQKVSAVSVDDKSRQILSSVRNESAVLVPNHSDYADALVMFLLSREIDATFNYMTASEIFLEGRFRAWKSFLIQQLGGYSVIRGSVDRDAFRTTRQLLQTGERPIVIFAEGGLTRQNDTVTPFESGVVQLCFWALDDLRKADQLKPVYAVPVGIKYIYDQNIWSDIELALSRLELEILPEMPPTDLQSYERLRLIGTKIMEVLEKEFRINVDSETTLDLRINILREEILQRIETFMEIKVHPETDFRKRIRLLKNTIDAELFKETEELSEYERKVHRQRSEIFRQFYIDIERLTNFITIYEDYVIEERSQERFMDVVKRLENEVFGQAKTQSLRTAQIRVGQPRNLTEIYDSYCQNKREVVQEVTLDLESSVQDLINTMTAPIKGQIDFSFPA